MFPRLRAPLVLVHGLYGFDQLSLGPFARWHYFHQLPERLREAGNCVYIPRLSPIGGIVQRATQLQAFIDAHVPDGPLHLVGHSMGGLDSRYLIARLPAGDRVLSLTTLGTPHRGSAFADWSARRLVRLVSPLLNRIGIPTQGFLDLTTRAMDAFNANVPNRPGVRYFSVAGEWGWHWHNPTWHLSFPVVSRAEGPNDGIVSLASARWGEAFEVWPGDHMTLANWPEPFVSSNQSDRLPRYAALLSRLLEI